MLTNSTTVAYDAINRSAGEPTSERPVAVTRAVLSPLSPLAVPLLLKPRIGVPKTNWDLFDEWWQKEIGARVSIALLSRSAQLTFYCPPFIRALEPRQARAGIVEFNRALAEVCKMIRTADVDVRAEALAELEFLAQEPPPWVPLGAARLDERTTLRKLGQALKLRSDA